MVNSPNDNLSICSVVIALFSFNKERDFKLTHDYRRLLNSPLPIGGGPEWSPFAPLPVQLIVEIPSFSQKHLDERFRQNVADNPEG